MGTLQEWPVFVWLCTYISTYLEYQYVSFSRNVLGTKNLGDILSERESIANMMQSTLDEATDPWGVKVERVEVWVTYFFWCFCDLVPDLTISWNNVWLISNAFLFFLSTFLIAIRTQGPYSKFNHQLKEKQSNWIPPCSKNLIIWKVIWISFVWLTINVIENILIHS